MTEIWIDEQDDSGLVFGTGNDGTILLNSSRSILYASGDDNFAKETASAGLQTSLG